MLFSILQSLKNKIVLFAIILLSSVHLSTSKANGVWDGGGDGISWHDPLNWGDDLEPLVTDIITIPASTTIQVSMAGEVAESINFAAATSILTILSGDLTLDEGGSGDLIDMPDGGTINISSGSTLRLQNGTNGIDTGDAATINNSGQLIFDDLNSEAFDIDDGPLMLTNQASGVIQGIAPFNGDFLDISNNANGSIIDNFGQILVDMDDRGSDFFDINGVTTIRNNAGALMDLDDIDDNVFDFNTSASGSTLDNFGTIDIFESGDEGFELVSGISLTNHSSGIIMAVEIEDEFFQLSGSAQVINDGLIVVGSIVGAGSVAATEEVVDIFSADGRFTNNGTITITGIENDEIIDVDQGIFTNNGIINMGMGFPPADLSDEAFNIGGGGRVGQVINTFCGIINITSTNPIEISAGSQLTNEGIITTIYTGSNAIDGVFLNEGILSTPNGIFNSMPNAAEGLGSITDSPIPATIPLCEQDLIPTMGQWGMICLFLFLLILGVITIKETRINVAYS